MKSMWNICRLLIDIIMIFFSLFQGYDDGLPHYGSLDASATSMYEAHAPRSAVHYSQAYGQPGVHQLNHAPSVAHPQFYPGHTPSNVITPSVTQSVTDIHKRDKDAIYGYITVKFWFSSTCLMILCLIVVSPLAPLHLNSSDIVDRRENFWLWSAQYLRVIDKF